MLCMPACHSETIFFDTLRVKQALFAQRNPKFNLSALPTSPSQRCSRGPWPFQKYFCLDQTEVKVTANIIKSKCNHSDKFTLLALYHVIYTLFDKELVTHLTSDPPESQPHFQNKTWRTQSSDAHFIFKSSNKLLFLTTNEHVWLQDCKTFTILCGLLIYYRPTATFKLT